MNTFRYTEDKEIKYGCGDYVLLSDNRLYMICWSSTQYCGLLQLTSDIDDGGNDKVGHIVYYINLDNHNVTLNTVDDIIVSNVVKFFKHHEIGFNVTYKVNSSYGKTLFNNKSGNLNVGDIVLCYDNYIAMVSYNECDGTFNLITLHGNEGAEGIQLPIDVNYIDILYDNIIEDDLIDLNIIQSNVSIEFYVK